MKFSFSWFFNFMARKTIWRNVKRELDKATLMYCYTPLICSDEFPFILNHHHTNRKMCFLLESLDKKFPIPSLPQHMMFSSLRFDFQANTPDTEETTHPKVFILVVECEEEVIIFYIIRSMLYVFVCRVEAASTVGRIFGETLCSLRSCICT